MNKPPAFMFYADDWLGSTQIMLMTPAEEGAYIRLLAIAWNAPDCSLPDDDKKLAALSRLGQRWFKGSSVKIRACFVSRRGKLFNKRLLNERKKQKQWRDKSRLGGITSAKVRRDKALRIKDASTTLQPPCIANGNSSSLSSSSSSSTNKNKNNDLATTLARDFLAQTSKAKQRKLIATTQSTSPFIRRLLNKNVTPELIRLTIKWLCTANLKREFQFDVQSGTALFHKWDRIQGAMKKDNTFHPKETDPVILEYARQYKKISYSGIFDSEKDKFFKKVKDNCGRDGKERVLRAMRQIPMIKSKRRSRC